MGMAPIKEVRSDGLGAWQERVSRLAEGVEARLAAVDARLVLPPPSPLGQVVAPSPLDCATTATFHQLSPNSTPHTWCQHYASTQEMA